MWYVVIDQDGHAKQHHFETVLELATYFRNLRLTSEAGPKGLKVWSRPGGRRRIVVASFAQWSDATRLVNQINETVVREEQAP